MCHFSSLRIDRSHYFKAVRLLSFFYRSEHLWSNLIVRAVPYSLPMVSQHFRPRRPGFKPNFVHILQQSAAFYSPSLFHQVNPCIYHLKTNMVLREIIISICQIFPSLLALTLSLMEKWPRKRYWEIRKHLALLVILCKTYTRLLSSLTESRSIKIRGTQNILRLFK